MKDNKSGSESWATYYQKTTDSNKNNYYPENFVTRIFLSSSPIKFINRELEGKHILDLGCGHGRHIPFLLNQALQVTGLEVSEQQIKKLKSDFENIDFICGTAADIPSTNNSYDFILASNSIYYLMERNSTIKSHFAECLRVLKPDGLLIFTLIGTQHSLLEDAKEVKDTKVFKIDKDFLGFRNGVFVQVYSDSIKQDIFSSLDILHHGEVIETVGQSCRHLHYFVARNSERTIQEENIL